MKILMVLTSHDQLGDTGKKTGFWLEELAAPYYRLIEAGADITLASPKGGQPPLDPKHLTTLKLLDYLVECLADFPLLKMELTACTDGTSMLHFLLHSQ